MAFSFGSHTESSLGQPAIADFFRLSPTLHGRNITKNSLLNSHPPSCWQEQNKWSNALRDCFLKVKASCALFNSSNKSIWSFLFVKDARIQFDVANQDPNNTRVIKQQLLDELATSESAVMLGHINKFGYLLGRDSFHFLDSPSRLYCWTVTRSEEAAAL